MREMCIRDSCNFLRREFGEDGGIHAAGRMVQGVFGSLIAIFARRASVTVLSLIHIYYFYQWHKERKLVDGKDNVWMLLFCGDMKGEAYYACDYYSSVSYTHLDVYKRQLAYQVAGG